MFKSMCIWLVLVYCYNPKEIFCKKLIPKYTVNLDAPAEKRWTNIMRDFTKYVPFMLNFLKQEVPWYVFSLAEKVALYVDKLFEEPYPSELKSVAEGINITLAEIIMMNVAYDLSAFCTSIVAKDNNGIIYHGRNLDYQHADSLKNLTIHVDFQRNGKTVYSGITFAAYIGLLTGQKPHAFTISLNERDKGYLWENIFQLLLVKTSPIGFFLRSLLADKNSNYEQAIEKISTTEMIAPAYIIVGGINNGAVITRDRTHAINVWKIDISVGRWFLVETNSDHWKSPPHGDKRRSVAIKAMDEMGQKNVSLRGLFEVLSTKPVLRDSTVYTCVMSAKFPSMFSAWTRTYYN